jgi:hypothetical protein
MPSRRYDAGVLIVASCRVVSDGAIGEGLALAPVRGVLKVQGETADHPDGDVAVAEGG